VVSLDRLGFTGFIKCMKHALFAVLLGSALVAGCSKKPGESPPAQPQPTDQATNAPADNSSAAPTAPVAPVEMPAPSASSVVISAPENGNMSKTLGDLSQAVRSYIVANHRQPTSFEDFVANSHIAVPPAPPGKKYALDRRFHVILVNQ